MKLVVNPFLQAQLAYALHIAGPWSVAQPVQGVQNRFVLAQLGDRQAALEGLGELPRLALLSIGPLRAFCRRVGPRACSRSARDLDDRRHESSCQQQRCRLDLPEEPNRGTALDRKSVV